MAAKLWRGSSGSSVRDLQTKLNQNGYKLDVDGVFGNKTYNAVLDYQRKNKLAVDGVVGNETWGSLNKTTKPDHKTTGKEVMSGVSDETYDKLHQLEKGFVPSDNVSAAREALKSMEASRPESISPPLPGSWSSSTSRSWAGRSFPTTRKRMRSIRTTSICIPRGAGMPWRIPWGRLRD